MAFFYMFLTQNRAKSSALSSESIGYWDHRMPLDLHIFKAILSEWFLRLFYAPHFQWMPHYPSKFDWSVFNNFPCLHLFASGLIYLPRWLVQFQMQSHLKLFLLQPLNLAPHHQQSSRLLQSASPLRPTCMAPFSISDPNRIAIWSVPPAQNI